MALIARFVSAAFNVETILLQEGFINQDPDLELALKSRNFQQTIELIREPGKNVVPSDVNFLTSRYVSLDNTRSYLVYYTNQSVSRKDFADTFAGQRSLDEDTYDIVFLIYATNTPMPQSNVDWITAENDHIGIIRQLHVDQIKLDVDEHFYGMAHELVPEDDALEILEEMGVTMNSLPIIHDDDVAIVFRNWPEHQMIRLISHQGNVDYRRIYRQPRVYDPSKK